MQDQEPDFSAAMQDQEESPDFAAAAIPKKRGRPIKPKPAPQPPSLLINNTILMPNINNLGIDDINLSVSDYKAVDIKGKLTNQELDFLEIYFNSPRIKGGDKMTINKAMISAGYVNYSDSGRWYIARKILEKYELAAPDAGRIMKALKFGPVKIAQGVIDLAEGAKSEVVKLQALVHASKLARMTEESTEKFQGINININCTAPAPAPGAPPPMQVAIEGQPEDAPKPRQPLRITR